MSLFQNLQTARIAGSQYMEEGELDDLAAYRKAATQVDRALDASDTFDEREERDLLRAVEGKWRAAARQLDDSRTGVGSPRDDAADPEDVFEAHLNSAIGGVGGLVEGSEREIRSDLAATRRLNRAQSLIALVALLSSLAIAALLARRLAAAALRPIHRLTQAARAFGSGHLGHRVGVTSSAELHEMAGSFNRMAGALQEQHGQLEQQAFTDSLTGIPNRALFEDRARHALNRTLRTRERVAVLMIDLDDFKLVNDGLGHASGDELITAAARRIDDATRPSDTVARLGGDEFAVLLESVRGLDDALTAAERIRGLFDAPFHLNGEEVVVTTSIGIAMAQDSLDAEELLRRADLAMYRVKEGGKDGSAFFDSAMEDRAVDRLDVLNGLRKALERDELVVHYQPIVNLETGAVVAAEALMRWDRPGHGLVPPLDFIPFAEATGLIQPMGAWILKEACTQAREWRANGGSPDIMVGVNISARQLMDPDFEQIVSRTLADTGLEPHGARAGGHRVVGDAEPRGDDPEARAARPRAACSSRSTTSARATPRSAISSAFPSTGSRSRGRSSRGSPTPKPTRGSSAASSSWPTASGCTWWPRASRRPSSARRSFSLGCLLGQGFLFARPLELPALRALLREQQGSGAHATG